MFTLQLGMLGDPQIGKEGKFDIKHDVSGENALTRAASARKVVLEVQQEQTWDQLDRKDSWLCVQENMYLHIPS